MSLATTKVLLIAVRIATRCYSARYSIAHDSFGVFVWFVFFGGKEGHRGVMV